jgi:hypothetical protein
MLYFLKESVDLTRNLMTIKIGVVTGVDEVVGQRPIHVLNLRGSIASFPHIRYSAADQAFLYRQVL